MQDQPRDVYEVANQLGGYVDASTPDDLAAFLKREAKEAAVLAGRLAVAEAHVERMSQALRVASGRLTWCVSAKPGVQTEAGAKLVSGWADEAIAAITAPIVVRNGVEGDDEDGDRPA